MQECKPLQLNADTMGRFGNKRGGGSGRGYCMEEDLEVGTLEEIIITIELKSLNPSQRLNPSLSLNHTHQARHQQPPTILSLKP